MKQARLFGKWNRNKGMSTLELLIAFAILTLAIAAVVLVIFGNQSLAIDTQTNIEALSRAQAGLESARAASRSDFASLQSAVATNDDMYTKSITVTDISLSTKQVTSYVSWSEGGLVSYVTLSTILTDWLNPANKCSPIISGNWKKPQSLGYFDLPSIEDATGVHVGGTKVYLTLNPSAPETDDFYIVDASDTSLKPMPEFSSFSTTYGLTDVVVSGLEAYVTADSQVAQVLVIDISDYTTLDPSKIEKKVDLTALGDSAVGKTLAYADERLYVGLTKSSGKEFRVLDVSTPSSPLEIGSGYEIGAAVNEILIDNDIAYLATASSTPLIVLDISGPVPTPIDEYAPPLSVLFGQSLARNSDNTRLYFGRTGGNANPKLLAFDPADLSTPAWTMNMSKNSGVYTMTLRSNFLFMTTADPDDSLQIWDVSSPSSPPTRFDTDPLNIQQDSTAGADCAGNLLYVGQHGQRVLQIIGPS